MNICSLPLHHDKLSEIKLSRDAPTLNIDIPSYKFYHTSSISAAGGVGMYIKSNLTANKREDLSFCNDDFETIWVEIDNLKAKNMLCCCAYRHPNTDISKFSDHLWEMLSITEKENKIIYTMGDFNVNVIDYDNHAPTNDFVNMMFPHHLQPSVLHPTRIMDSSSTLIDNIFVNNLLGHNIQSGNILSLISDHLPQFCIISDFIYDYKKVSHISYDYSHFDADRFLADYIQLDTSFLFAKVLVWLINLIVS